MNPPVAADVPPARRPRHRRYWFALAAAALLGAVLLATVTDGPDRPLDPASTGDDGGRALSRVLGQFGVTVQRATSLPGTATDTTVLVTDPDAYRPDRLRRLAASAGRVVLVRPGRSSGRALLPGFRIDAEPAVQPSAGCALPAAVAAGTVAWPDDAATYRAAAESSCWGGAVLADGDVIALGSADLLTNDVLGRAGAAALAVNLLTADRTVTAVRWVLPGADATGDAPAGVWDLFPDGARRAFWWALVAGALLVLWRARRLGPAATEPLPVVVRAAELVEGHGRLHARAGARDRAAAALRRSALRRLADTAGLPDTASPAEVAAVLAARSGRASADVVGLLAGPAPHDDAALVGLARDLDALVASAKGS